MSNIDDMELFVRNNNGNGELDLYSLLNLTDAALNPAIRQRISGAMKPKEFAQLADDTERRVEEVCAEFAGSIFIELFASAAKEVVSQYRYISKFLESGRELLNDIGVLEPMPPVTFNESEESVYKFLKRLESEKQRGNLPVLKSAEKYSLLNDKSVYSIVGNFFSLGEIDGQTFMDFAVNETSKKSAPVAVYLTLTYDGDDANVLGRRINAFDESVFNAVCTFSFCNKSAFTGTELWRLMNGYHGNVRKNPTKNQLEKVINSLEKLSGIRLHMDFSEELKAGFFAIDDDRVTNGCVNTFFLPAESCILKTANGKIVSGYELLREPFFFTYHRAKKHVITVPYELLSAGAAGGKYHVEFRDFMLKRISSMKAGVFGSRYIELTGSDAIYRNVGIPTPEERIRREDYSSNDSYRASIRREAAGDKDVIEGILDAWTKGKFIKGFSFKQGANNRFTKVKITL